MRYLLILFVLLSLTSCGHKQGRTNRQILRLNLADDPVSLDPRVVRSLKDLTLVKQLFEGLMRIDGNGVAQLAMAKEVDVSDDLLTYIFHLREAYWTNGEPVTAYDFAYSWKSLLNPDFRTDYSYMLYPIKNAKAAREGIGATEAIGVEALDPQTLVVKLEAPTPYFLELTAFPTYFPVNHKLDKELDKWAQPPANQFVSNGPFKVKQWTPQSEIELVKNPLYWDAPSVRLNGLNFTMISDNNTESHLFEKNELDWLGQPTSHNITTELISSMKEKKQLESFTVAGTFWFKFNTEKSPFDQPKLRRAFSFAIDREEIIEHILQGGQAPATGPLPPSMQVRNKPYFKDGDKELAKRLFEEALVENGWTRDTFPRVVLNYPPTERNTKIVQLVQQQWNKVFNIEIRLEGVENQLYRQNVRQGLYQVGTGDWIADFNDPLAFLELFKYRNQDGNGMNDTGWYHETFFRLLDSSLTERDPIKRQSLLAEAEKILIDEMPIAPVYHYAFDYVKKNHVKDVVLSPLGTADFKIATIE
ncbi:MAG: peptide ABC transporter substrate-binding protein [Chlamydiales bacterium]|nr:peptide ABC transporter substrate-binding protein [Chlamydiales bacterium]